MCFDPVQRTEFSRKHCLCCVDKILMRIGIGTGEANVLQGHFSNVESGLAASQADIDDGATRANALAGHFLSTCIAKGINDDVKHLVFRHVRGVGVEYPEFSSAGYILMSCNVRFRYPNISGIKLRGNQRTGQTRWRRRRVSVCLISRWVYYLNQLPL